MKEDRNALKNQRQRAAHHRKSEDGMRRFALNNKRAQRLTEVRTRELLEG